MHTRSTLLGVIAALALLSAPLRHAAAQATPANGSAAHTYVPEAIQDQLAEVMRAEAPFHQVTTRTTAQGTTVVLEIPPEHLLGQFVTASDVTAARAALEETPHSAPEAEWVLIQVHPDGSIDIVNPHGELQQIK